MYEELIENLRSVKDTWQTEDENWMLQAADAIEGLMRERDMYLEGMAKEHNKAARILWEKEHQWISVKERLPDDGVYVLGRYRNNDMAVVCVFEHDEDFAFWRAMVDEGWETDCDIEPTHWTPLPKPPKEEAT